MKNLKAEVKVRDLSDIGWCFDWGEGDQTDVYEEEGCIAIVEVIDGKVYTTVKNHLTVFMDRERGCCDKCDIEDLIELKKQNKLKIK